MSTQTLDYDALAQQHGAVAGAQVDYDSLAQQHGAVGDKEQSGWLDKNIPLDSYTHATLSGVQSIARGTRDAVKGTWDTLTKGPQDDHEKNVAGIAGPGGLALYRTLRGIGHSAEDATQIASAIHDINQSPDPTASYLKAAGDTAAQGAAQALTALGTEGLAKAVPAVVDAASAAKDNFAPAVRAGARGVNKVLAKAPGTVGGAAGAAVGGYLGGHVGAELGGGAGALIGKEVLPQVRIPGEGFGFPNRVVGGPKTITPEIEPPASEAAPATTEPIAAAAPTSAAAAPAAESKLAPTFRDATLNKRNIPEYAGEDFGDVVDQHIRPTGQTRGSNLKAKAEIDFYLKRGDVDAAQAVLDKAKPQTPSSSTPTPQTSATPAGTLYSKETPNVVPGTRNIQENDALVKDAENKGRGYNNPDRLDDKAIQQESNWDLEKQGYRSESEARREFIARNSTGTTKGELIAQANAAKAAQPKAAAAAAGAGGEDLTQKLQDSLDTIKVGQGGVMTSAAPADLAKRWGVDPESLSAGREQTRGMSPEQTEQYINKLAESYKKGRPVEPVMETRDADNNIVSVDGRARAIAAQRAGVERIPIMIRRMPKPVKVLQ